MHKTNRKNKKRVLHVTAIFTALVISAVSAFAYSQRSGRSVEADQGQGLQSTKMTVEELQALPGNVVTALTQSMLADISLEDLAEKSSLVVYGEIVEISDPFFVEGAEGCGSDTVMDVTVQPLRMLRGEAEKTVVVRISGGLFDAMYYESDDIPEFQLGEKWLLYLNRPAFGGGTNAEGDYYYLTGGGRGAFKEMGAPEITTRDQAMRASLAQANENEEITFVNGLVVETGAMDQRDLTLVQEPEDIEHMERPEAAVFVLSDLASILSEFNETHPYDPDAERNSWIETCGSNLKNGMITQDEYDRFMSQMDEYAQTFTEEEYRERRGTLTKER